MSDDDNNEEIINTSFCPYKKAKNLFSGMFSRSNQDNNITQSTAMGTEMSINQPDEERGQCPFGYGKAPQKKIKEEGRCPFGYDKASSSPETSSSEKEKQKDKQDLDDDIDSEEEKPQGGCPVMNKGKKDPVNKHFEQYYEIPCFGPYDFLFLLRGSLDTEEWLEKTEKLRGYPRYLRNTLFYQAQEKLQKVHEKEFPMVFFIYDDIKQKANRLYRRKKYKEAIEHMTYCYGLLRWIQFKDKNRQKDFVVKPSLDAILDDDLELKEVYLDDVKVEEDSYKACKVFLLEIMAYAHMELRQYHCAIECLDECEQIAEDKVSDVFFRRSQARTYNRDSTDEDLELAMKDIEKAIQLKDSEVIYKEHKEKLEKIIKERNDEKVGNVRRLIQKAQKKLAKVKEMNLNLEEVFFVNNEDAERQYKILKDMKSKYNMAVKFFNETKNEEQLALTYKEFESFHKSYEQFKFFYKFKINELDPKIKAQLTEEEKKFMEEKDFNLYIDEYKYKVCENVFSEGNYNIELFQYSLEKVFEEERKAEEEKEKAEEALRPKVTWTQYLLNITKSNYTIYFSIFFVICSFLAIGSQYFMYSDSGIGKQFK